MLNAWRDVNKLKAIGCQFTSGVYAQRRNHQFRSIKTASGAVQFQSGGNDIREKGHCKLSVVCSSLSVV